MSHFFGCTLGYKSAAFVSSLGAKVDYMVRDLYDIKVVLDDNYGIPLISQSIKNFYKLVDIKGVQTGRRLVKDINGLARRPA